MTQPGQQADNPYEAGDVKLKIVKRPLTEAEARAWLAQPVHQAGDASRTINTEEVQGA